MITDISEPVGSKKQEESFCFNCGHSLLNHAYYQLLEGHIIVEYDVMTLYWMGYAVKIPYPCVRKGICPCNRFVSKKDYELEMARRR